MPSEKPSASQPRRAGRPRAFDRDQVLSRALEVFWQRGYEPASVSELCKSMGINPPSLYAAFGSKARLFLEAVDHYETVYWDATWARLNEEPDVHQAFNGFLHEAAEIFSSLDGPCGCMVMLAAINVSPDSQEVIESLKALRQEGKQYFQQRLERGVEEGQLPQDTNVKALAATLNTLLEGMAIQARDGDTRTELEGIASVAMSLLPSGSDDGVRTPASNSL